MRGNVLAARYICYAHYATYTPHITLHICQQVSLLRNHHRTSRGGVLKLHDLAEARKRLEYDRYDVMHHDNVRSMRLHVEITMTTPDKQDLSLSTKCLLTFNA